MATNSSIEWTEATWNPVAGCTIISPGCTNCYAMRMARRLEAMGQEKYSGLTRMSGGRPKWNGKISLDEKSLLLPESWKKGRTIFVNSMSDLFHEAVPTEFVERVFSVMRNTPQHTYQILTKRPERLSEFDTKSFWPDNVWMGTSVESEDYLFRIDHLRLSLASVKFLSLEPLLGPLVDLNLINIDWVIAGGESGPGARPIEYDWIADIRDQCVSASVAFHFKQWGGANKKKTGRTIDGRTWDELPERSHLNSYHP
jgi:protein gp37